MKRVFRSGSLPNCPRTPLFMRLQIPSNSLFRCLLKNWRVIGRSNLLFSHVTFCKLTRSHTSILGKVYVQSTDRMLVTCIVYRTASRRTHRKSHLVAKAKNAKARMGTINTSRIPKKMKPLVTRISFPPSSSPQAMGYKNQRKTSQPPRAK